MIGVIITNTEEWKECQRRTNEYLRTKVYPYLKIYDAPANLYVLNDAGLEKYPILKDQKFNSRLVNQLVWDTEMDPFQCAISDLLDEEERKKNKYVRPKNKFWH